MTMLVASNTVVSEYTGLMVTYRTVVRSFTIICLFLLVSDVPMVNVQPDQIDIGRVFLASCKKLLVQCN